MKGINDRMSVRMHQIHRMNGIDGRMHKQLMNKRLTYTSTVIFASSCFLYFNGYGLRSQRRDRQPPLAQYYIYIYTIYIYIYTILYYTILYYTILCYAILYYTSLR